MFHFTFIQMYLRTEPEHKLLKLTSLEGMMDELKLTFV